MAHFKSPAIQENPGGWGPCSVPEQYKDMPYQPFSKGDRLGKVSVQLSFMISCIPSQIMVVPIYMLWGERVTAHLTPPHIPP